VKTTTKRLSSSQNKKLDTLLNKGSAKELQAITGIGEAKANVIRSARPIKGVEDLANVTGFGKKTYGDVIDWAKKTF